MEKSLAKDERINKEIQNAIKNVLNCEERAIFFVLRDEAEGEDKMGLYSFM